MLDEVEDSFLLASQAAALIRCPKVVVRPAKTAGKYATIDVHEETWAATAFPPMPRPYQDLHMAPVDLALHALIRGQQHFSLTCWRCYLAAWRLTWMKWRAR